MILVITNTVLAQSLDDACQDYLEKSLQNFVKKSNLFNDNVSIICERYNNIKKSSYNLTNNPNLTKEFLNYTQDLEKMIEDLSVIDRNSKIINQVIAGFNNKDIKWQYDLKELLNKGIDYYNYANYSYNRVQQNIGQIGSFLIGSSGYVKLLGENNYLSVEQDNEGNNIPLMVKIIPAYYTRDDMLAKSCLEGTAISFEVGDNNEQFFDDNPRLVTFISPSLEIRSKSELKATPTSQSTFCVERSVDGFRLRMPGDYFLAKSSNSIDQNINSAGTFIFVSNTDLNNSYSINRGNFKIGQHGYLNLIENNRRSDKFLNLALTNRGSDITDKIKLKIIEPFATSPSVNQCEAGYALSFEEIDNKPQDYVRVLAFDNSGLYLKSADKIISGLDQKTSTFCLEKKGNYFRIRTAFNFYIDNLKDFRTGSAKTNNLTSFYEYAGVFDFVDIYNNSQNYSANQIDGFKLGSQGYIRLVTSEDSTDNKYVQLNPSFSTVMTDVQDNEINFKPERFQIIAPRSYTADKACDNNISAVSFEFAHDRDYILARDEWGFKKINKYANYNLASTTFCLENKDGGYAIKDLDNYYFEKSATGFTKNNEEIGVFDFVGEAYLLNKGYIDKGGFQNLKNVYVKSTIDNIYLIVKDINNYHYNLKAINIEEVQSDPIEYCPGAISIKIKDSLTDDLLTNYYGNLYFVNKNLEMPSLAAVFCLRKLSDGYTVFSRFNKSDSPLYLSNKINGVTTDITEAAKIEFINNLDINQVTHLQGDVGLFRVNSIGYIKLRNINRYLNTIQYDEQYFSRELLPVKFRVLEPFGNEEDWCRNSMAISLEDFYNPGLVLGFDSVTTKLKLLPKSLRGLEHSAVFCLVKSENYPGAYKLKNKDDYYVDNSFANSLTNNLSMAGEFVFTDLPLDPGTGNNSLMNKAAGQLIGFNSGAGMIYYDDNINNLNFFTTDVWSAKGLVITPGLANNYCMSFKDNDSNKYLSLDSGKFILKEFEDNTIYAENSTLCPVVEPFNHNIVLYLNSNINSYLRVVDNVLISTSSSKVPLGDNSFAIQLVNKRNILKKADEIRQALTSVDCSNLAPLGKIVGNGQYDIVEPCPELDDLRAKMLNDISTIEDDDRCCSGVSHRVASATIPFDDNRQCKIQYDMFCENRYY